MTKTNQETRIAASSTTSTTNTTTTTTTTGDGGETQTKRARESSSITTPAPPVPPTTKPAATIPVTAPPPASFEDWFWRMAKTADTKGLLTIEEEMTTKWNVADFDPEKMTDDVFAELFHCLMVSCCTEQNYCVDANKKKVKELEWNYFFMRFCEFPIIQKRIRDAEISKKILHGVVNNLPLRESTANNALSFHSRYYASILDLLFSNGMPLDYFKGGNMGLEMFIAMVKCSDDGLFSVLFKHGYTLDDIGLDDTRFKEEEVETTAFRFCNHRYKSLEFLISKGIRHETFKFILENVLSENNICTMIGHKSYFEYMGFFDTEDKERRDAIVQFLFETKSLLAGEDSLPYLDFMFEHGYNAFYIRSSEGKTFIERIFDRHTDVIAFPFLFRYVVSWWKRMAPMHSEAEKQFHTDAILPPVFCRMLFSEFNGPYKITRDEFKVSIDILFEKNFNLLRVLSGCENNTVVICNFMLDFMVRFKASKPECRRVFKLMEKNGIGLTLVKTRQELAGHQFFQNKLT